MEHVRQIQFNQATTGNDTNLMYRNQETNPISAVFFRMADTKQTVLLCSTVTRMTQGSFHDSSVIILLRLYGPCNSDTFGIYSRSLHYLSLTHIHPLSLIYTPSLSLSHTHANRSSSVKSLSHDESGCFFLFSKKRKSRCRNGCNCYHDYVNTQTKKTKR